MSNNEMGLTGLALALLAFWEASIATIPLGLYTIHYDEQPQLFTALLLQQQLIASFWLTRGIRHWLEQYRSSQVKPSTGDKYRYHHGS